MLPSASSADAMKQADILATPGGVGHARNTGTEGGVPGVPGTPVPGGPLRSDPMPPLMPDYGRTGEEGFEATEQGIGAGVASGGELPQMGSARGVGNTPFHRGKAWPTVGVTAEDVSGQQTIRGVTDPEDQVEVRDGNRDADQDRECDAKEDDQGDERASANPNARDVVGDAPQPGSNM
jgi:hypothetical protein